MDLEKLYVNCCNIINKSNDDNIKEKQNKLNWTYKKLCEHEDCELQQFYSIVLELNVYKYLSDNGFTLKVADDKKIGPDFECDFGYLECVSVTKGEKGTPGRDFVDKQLSGSVNRHKSELPRISSAIKDKKDKFNKYDKNNILEKNIPRIIVVGTSIFANEFNSSSCIEDVMQILYSIGNEYLLFDVKSKQFIETENNQYRTYDNSGKKSEDIILELGYFYKNEYKNISAVILVCNSIFEEVEKNNFKIFLNPNATYPIDRALISTLDYFSFIKEDNGNFIYTWN